MWNPRAGGEKLSCISLLGELLESPPQGGEKVDPTGNDWYTQGSPPRGRGKALLLLDAGVVVGITPAWAGKSGRR